MLDPTQLLWTQIAAGACLLIFVGMVFGLPRLRRRVEASKRWLKANGEILVSEIKLPQTHTSDDQDDARVVVRYRYGVDAKTYEGDGIKIGGQTSMMRALAETLVARYPVGAEVDVYYDPRDPKDAVLEPHEQSSGIAQLAVTLVFGIVGIVLALHAMAGKVLTTENDVPLFAFALPGAAFIAAIAGVISFLNGRQTAKDRAQWPTVPGTVTTSDIIEETIESKRSEDTEILRTTKRYRVDLRYTYRVGQRGYVGTNRVWEWTAVYGLREQAKKVTSAYPQGKSVTVYYDPAQPGLAVLEPGNRQGSLAPLIFGGISAIAGALLLLFFVGVGFGH
jgi:hypothetical protein